MKISYKIGIIAYIFFALTSLVNAQTNEITLSGTIVCDMPTMGALSFVNIYNKNTKKGTVSNAEGKFSIKMGKNDTILFSTVQHIEQSYYMKKGDFFYDKNIKINMVQDTVWLDVVSIMGAQNFNEFKQEITRLKLAPNDISYALPIVDKYAKQNSTGEGQFEIKGPLTYLSSKILLIGKRKNNFKP